MTEGAEAPQVVRLRDVDVKVWELPPGPRDGSMTLRVVQDPLTYFEKFELFGLISSAVDQVLDEAGGIMGIGQALGIDRDVLRAVQAQEWDELKGKDFSQLLDLAGVVTKLLRAVPSVALNAYLIFLSVEPEDRNGVSARLRRIDDATGLAMLDTFVAQNAEPLKDFLPRLWDTITASVEKVQNAPSSTESSDGSAHSSASKSSTPPTAEVETDIGL